MFLFYFVFLARENNQVQNILMYGNTAYVIESDPTYRRGTGTERGMDA